MIKSWRTKKQIKESLFINRRERPKMDYFLSLNKGFTYGAKEKKRKREEIKLRYGFLYGYMTFSWILVCFLYTNYLGMITRVFLED